MLTRLVNWALQYQRSSSGNVTMTFALAFIPIIAGVGAAVDFSRGSSAKVGMQAALDAAGLFLSKNAQSLTAAQLQSSAQSVFLANFNRTDVQNVSVTATYATALNSSYTLTLNVTGTVPTTIMSIWQPTMAIGATTEVVWGMKRLELVLALDNTGSMSSSGKMTQLKTAAKNLLATLKKAAKKPDDIKVAIVPFDKSVNLGTSYKDNDWFEYDSLNCGGGGCNSSNWKNYWNGCVRDRTYPYDAQDDAPTSADRKFPVFRCGSLVSLLPLTNDWTALNSKVDSMTPDGNTNVTIGLTWAWHALTAGAPLSEASVPKSDLDKVIILLTDGQNTEAWKNSNNSTVTSSSTIDLRTSLACTNIKAANIKIYTIRVIDGNAALLQACATTPSMYYNVQDASQLSGVFSSIAEKLANLRINK